MSGNDPTLTNEDPISRRDVIDAPHVFVSFSSTRPLVASSRHRLSGVDEVLFVRGEAPGARRVDRRLELSLPDRWVSSRHARIVREGSAFVLEDLGSKNGTRMGGELVTRAPLASDATIEVGRTFVVFRKRVSVARTGPVDRTLEVSHDAGLASLSPAVEAISEVVRAVAGAPLPVLVLGESGTGKELLARAVHGASARRGAFVAINCAALPPTVLEGELFGHRRGAFTGAADDRPGLVRAADGGTLFLDEIAELSAGAQAALLRVLQEREVRAIGATTSVPVDFRVVAATNAPLARLAADGRFRADLFARLRGAVISLPPLRDRLEDLGLLVGTLLRRHAPAAGESTSFEADAARALFEHAWPMNVRELEQRIAAATLLAGQGPVRREHLFPETAPRRTSTMPPPGLDAEDEAIKARLVILLAETGGNVSEVARRMGKARMQVQRWIRRYRLGEE